MNDKKNGILGIIGMTPVVEIKNLFNNKFRLYAKLEMMNPTGSAKDRSAYSMMLNALNARLINEETVIIESSSGNLGIALAQICMLWKLKFICVVDPKITSMNLQLLNMYGAKIEFVTKKVNGEYLPSRIQRVNELLSTIPNSFSVNQYSNINNPKGHQKTFQEVLQVLNVVPDFVFCPVSTCGTIRGYRDSIQQNKYHTKLIAVDAVGSAIYSNQIRKRLLPGHGAAQKSGLFEVNLADDFVCVTDEESVWGCRKLFLSEGILAGGSTGAVIAAINKYKNIITDDMTVWFPVYDKGDRYLETIYSDQWVMNNFGVGCSICKDNLIFKK